MFTFEDGKGLGLLVGSAIAVQRVECQPVVFIG